MSRTSEPIPNYRPASTTPQTPAYKLFHYRWVCEVAQMHLFDRELIEARGMITTHDAALDRAQAIQPVQCQLTIAEMADMHHRGIALTLVTPQDATRIYTLIHEHLKAWEDAAQHSLFVRDAPTEDLQLFDALAAEIYPLARRFAPRQNQWDPLRQWLQRRERTHGRQLAKSVETPVEAAPEHTPMSSLIQQHLDRRGRPWDADT